jgi:hypothetical protein
MNIAQLRHHAESKPFRAFRVSLVSGESLLVNQPREIGISPHKPHLITVFTPDGLAHLFESTSIVKIAGSSKK